MVIGREKISGREESSPLPLAVLFISWAVLFLAALFFVARIGFDPLFRETACTVGLFLFLVNGPLLFWRNRAPLFHYALILVGLLVIPVPIAFLCQDLLEVVGPSVGWVFFVLGVFVSTWNTWRWRKSLSGKGSIALMVLAALFSLWLTGRLWGPHIIHPLYMEALATGKGFIDTLFHMALSQMIRTHHVVTTGVDGLASFRYHAGSHGFVAGWAVFLGIPLHIFTLLADFFLIMPLFYLGVLLFSLTLAEWMGNSLSLDPTTREGSLFWFLFFLLFIRLLPDRALFHLAVFETFDYSPSYFLGLAFLFLFLALFLTTIRNPKPKLAVVWIEIPMALILLGTLKNSLMVLAGAGYGYLMLRKKEKRWTDWAGLGIAAAVGLATLGWVTDFHNGSKGIRLLAFLKDHVRLHLLPYHILVYFGWIWLYLFLRFKRLGIRSSSARIAAIRTKKLLDVETLLLIAALGILPGLFLDIPSGSAHYFSDVATRMAIPMILAQAGWLAQKIEERGRGIRLVGGMLSLLLLWKILFVAGFYAKGNLALRRDLHSDHAEIVARKSFLLRLKALDGLPTREKRSRMIHVARSDTLFWHHFLDREPGQTISLLVPAITGIVLLDGLPPKGVPTASYGFPVYPKRTDHPQTKAMLCRDAILKGFPEAEILHFDRIDAIPEVIHCPRIYDERKSDPTTQSRDFFVDPYGEGIAHQKADQTKQ